MTNASLPADALLHPAALAAIVLLLLNDHVLKAAAPGFATGKLSDVAGLAFFPLVLLGTWEVAVGCRGRWSRPVARPLMVSVAVTGIGFVGVKTTVLGANAFGLMLGAGQWALGSLLTITPPTASISPALVVVDPSDLLALPGLLVAVWIGLARVRARPEPS